MRVEQHISHMDIKSKMVEGQGTKIINKTHNFCYSLFCFTFYNSPLIKNVRSLHSNPVIIRHVLPIASSTVLCRSDVLATFIKSLLRKNNLLYNVPG